MVWAAVLVVKSVLVVLLAAVSALQTRVAMVLVGAVVSTTKAWLRTVPSLPAVSVTLTLRVLLVVKVRAKLHAVLPTLVVAVAQLVPLSMDTYTVSPASSAVLKVPLTVWAVVLVLKSVLVLPLAAVSALSTRVAMVEVGASVSST